MMAGSHVAVGLAAWVWVAPHVGLAPFDPAALVLTAGGALLPDIDHPRSWVGRRIPLLSRPLARIFGHRGFTHSLLAVAAGVLALRTHGVLWDQACPLAVGYLSHLAADLVTPAGLRLAWPLRPTYALPLCRTGSWLEWVWVAALVVTVAWPYTQRFK